jgi:drug/metabolite transporter (DMT)-like permease
VLAILTGMIAHGCIAFAQQHLPIATITVMQTSQPALAVFFAFLILGESVRGLQVVGMILVIVGIASFTLVSQRGPETRSAAPAARGGSSSARS